MLPDTTEEEYYNNKILSNRYKIVRKIGSGAFGSIYEGQDIVTGASFAAKIEPGTIAHPQLEYESMVYQLLVKDSDNFPKVHDFFNGSNDNVMIMQLLGPSLEQLFNKYDRTFSVKTVCNLAHQMICRIEALHENNFIHRDIKPDNFVIGLDNESGKVFLLDFGLAKRYRNPTTHAHISFREHKSLTGTARYASINTHEGLEQSRRDDLESLGYVLVYFLVKQLPWQGLKANSKSDKYNKIYQKKLGVPPQDLCRNLPDEFMDYFAYVRGLKFTDRPDYDYLRNLFKAIMSKKNENINDGILEWTVNK